MLNGQKLTMSPIDELPILSPKVLLPNRGRIISMPPMSIFFLVMPNIKSRTCATNPVVPRFQDARVLSKRFSLLTREKEKNVNLEKSLYETDADQPVYVSFNKRQVPYQPGPILRLNLPPLVLRIPRLHDNNRRISMKPQENTNPDDLPVKYITFNDNSWLNKLKDTMSNIKSSEEPEKEEVSTAELEKYAPLTNALIGRDLTMADEINTSRLKRSSTINPELQAIKADANNKANGKIEISNLPGNVIQTLKQVQVTFTNLDDPKILSDSEGNESKRIIVRHVNYGKINDEQEKAKENLKGLNGDDDVGDDEKTLDDKIPKIVDDMNCEEVEKLISSEAVANMDKEDQCVNADDSSESDSSDESTEDLTKIEHVQKIKPNKEKNSDEFTNTTEIVLPGIPEAHEEKIINNILSDIIRQNNEQPPIITDITDETNHPDHDEDIKEVAADNTKDKHLFISTSDQGKEVLIEEADPKVISKMQAIFNPVLIEEQNLPTLASTSDPSELEAEITKTNEGDVKSKVLRQVSAPEEIVEQKDIEKLSEATADTNSSSSDIPQQNENNWLKIPLLPKELKLSADALLAERKERLEEFKDKLRESSEKLKSTITDNANIKHLWGSIKQREEELRNIFKNFDKRETNFSPYEGTRGIQFVTTIPVDDELISKFQIDPIKSRPRRLIQPIKMVKTNFYERIPYHRMPYHYLNPSLNPSRMRHFAQPHGAEIEKPLYGLLKSDNQYIFPLDSKTQGIVYNNKIYPAKLFGVVDVAEQKETDNSNRRVFTNEENIKAYNPIEDLHYVDKPLRKESEKYSTDVVEDYSETDYPTEYEASESKKDLIPKPTNDEQPYIPVVILSQKDKQFLPNIKNERPRRAIEMILDTLENIRKGVKNYEGEIRTKEQSLSRKKRSALFNPNAINDLKYRYKLRNKFENNFNKNSEEKILQNNFENSDLDEVEKAENDINTKLETESEIGICREVGTSSESIIEEDDIILHKTDMNGNKNSHPRSVKEKKEDQGSKIMHRIISMITDDFKNFIAKIYPSIFRKNNE